MTIMRSEENIKDKLFKRRLAVNWNDVRIRLEDQSINGYYLLLKTRSFGVSDNRLSYWAFLHFFDKKILDYYRLTRDINCFNVDFDLYKGRIVIN